jgi:hypothetical protein
MAITLWDETALDRSSTSDEHMLSDERMLGAKKVPEFVILFRPKAGSRHPTDAPQDTLDLVHAVIQKGKARPKRALSRGRRGHVWATRRARFDTTESQT